MTYTKEKMRDYIAALRKERRLFSLKQLGGKCKKCSSTKKLQYDHIDPSTKISTIANMWTSSKEKFEEELTKCQLLCERCHIKKTNNERIVLPIKHGKTWTYNHHKCRCEPCGEAKRKSRKGGVVR